MKTILKLQIHKTNLCVLRLENSEDVPEKIWDSSFLSITRTDEELSIVCEKEYCPESGRIESGFGSIKIVGSLEFSLTGILNSLLEPLARIGIPVFAISTFDTDYILVKNDQLLKARKILAEKPEIEFVK